MTKSNYSANSVSFRLYSKIFALIFGGSSLYMIVCKMSFNARQYKNCFFHFNHKRDHSMVY